MQILEAEISGTCFGVRDALAAAAAIENPRDVIIHGELLHNPAINRQLAARGFVTALTINGLPRERGAILITAHGVSNRTRAEIAATGKRIIDTTCPLVRRAHRAAILLAGQGFHVLIIGKRGHVEVSALSGDLSSFDVLESPAEARRFASQKLGVVCQTTTPTHEAREIFDAIARANPEAEIRFVDTICRPTKDRQRALERLLARVELMVIVGGRHSNNTLKLVERCRRGNVRVIHVEGAGELPAGNFAGVERVGLAAGTSTLPETVAAVRRELEEISRQQGACSCRN